MTDSRKTKQALIEEIQLLREEIADLKSANSAGSIQPLPLLPNLQVDKSLIGIFIVKRGGHITDCNPTFCHLLGYTREEMIGKSALEFTAHKERSRIRNLVKQLRSAEISQFQLDRKYIRKDKTIVSTITVAVGKYDANNELTHAVVSVVDLTEQLRAENERLESDRRFRKLFEYSPFGMVIVDPEARKFVDANQKYCQLLGYSREEISQIGIDSIIATHDGEKPRRLSEKLKNGEIESYQTGKYIRKKNGQIIHCRVTRSTLQMDDKEFIIAMLEDTTEKEAITAALQKNQAQLRAIFDSTSDRIFAIDTNYQLTAFNKSFAIAVKHIYNEALFIGMNMIPDHVAPIWKPLYDRALAGETFMEEMDFPMPSQEVLHIVLTLTPIRNKDGEVIGCTIYDKDISAIKAAEKTVREQHRYLRQIVDQIPAYVFARNSAGEYTMVNQAILDALGLDREEIIGKRDINLLPVPQEADSYKLDDEKIFDNSQPHLLERQKFTGPDGQTIWVQIAKTPIFGEEGNVREVLGLATDITRLVDSEQALKRSQKRLNLALSSANMGVFTWDIKNRRVYWDEQLHRIHGISEDEFGGTYEDFMRTVHPDDIPLIQTTINDCMAEQKPFTLEYRQVKPHGEMQYTRVFGSTIFDEDGNPLVMTGVCADITKAKQAEAAIRASEERYRMIFDSALVAICEIDITEITSWLERIRKMKISDIHSYLFKKPSLAWVILQKHRLLDVNNQVLELLGATKVEDLQNRCSHMFTEASLPHLIQGLTHIYEGESTFQYETVLQSLQGIRIDAIVQGKIVSENNKPRRLYLSITDISEWRRAESERHSLEQQVLHVQKLESLGVLAGGIAHDFNNLLTAILGNSELLEYDLVEGDAYHESVKTITRCSLQAAELCKQMLAYAGKHSFTMEPVQLNAIIQEMPVLLSTAISRDIDIIYELDNKLPAVMADPIQLRQVALNLLMNAAEAIDHNKGSITLKTATIEASEDSHHNLIEGQPLPRGRYSFIEVTDNGGGMENTIVRKIFDPFFSTKFAGRGLGLATVLGIVRSHNGGIYLESEAGEGTSVRVYFPALDKAILPHPGIDLDTKNWRGSGLVLVADDEEFVRDMTRRILERSGFSVITARDGQEALELFHEHEEEIKLVLLDVMMPRMKGDEVLQKIREAPSEIPVILFSGYSAKTLIDSMRQYRGVFFLEKPFQRNSLLRIIQTGLQNRPSHSVGADG